MGEVVDVVLDVGGCVVGVILEFMVFKEIVYMDLFEFYVVQFMYVCKVKMVKFFQGFIVLFGGIGMMEELFEIWIWGQFGQYCYLVGLFNVDGYYNDLVSFFDKMMVQGFLVFEYWGVLKVDDWVEGLLDQFECYEVLEVDVRFKIFQI